MSKIFYCHEKFSTAVRHMAASPKPLQERISDAYKYHLIYINVEELPEEIQADFEDFKAHLNSRKKVNEGPVNDILENMSEIVALEIAQKIVYMAEVIEARLRNK